ncbi:MAG TPA: ZIP family metal transporter [Gaiellaceae bacterium]|jgi:ZIP family zinc transporter|nr:ZIP family metal transporter [Gaiellaceae bacterium]
MTWLALPFAALTVAAAFAGGIAALRLSRDLRSAIALTGGVVVAVAVFHVLPEAIEIIGDPHRVGLLVGTGFLTFFLAERVLVLHHRDAPEEARSHSHVGALGAGAVAVHTFIDGLGIGLAFSLDTTTGILVFVAVIAHDFADGLNAVAFVLHQGGSRARAVRWLTVVAVAPLLGAIVGGALSVGEDSLGTILALYAGFFLFMGGSDLLPHAHEHPSWRRVALTTVGFLGVLAVSTVAAH